MPLKVKGSDPHDDERIALRAVTTDDARALGEFLTGLQPDARQLRFFRQASQARIDSYWRAPDHAIDHYGLLAQAADGRIVGHAAYIRLYGSRAELALDIAEGIDRAALASRLVRRLAEIARENGIRRFVAAGPTSDTDIVELFVRRAKAADQIGGWSVVEFSTAAPDLTSD